LRMGDGDSIIEHLNNFNSSMTQSILIGMKMGKEDHCMTLLCYLSISWDNLVMAIVSTPYKYIDS